MQVETALASQFVHILEVDFCEHNIICASERAPLDTGLCLQWAIFVVFAAHITNLLVGCTRSKI